MFISVDLRHNATCFVSSLVVNLCITTSMSVLQIDVTLVVIDQEYTWRGGVGVGVGVQCPIKLSLNVYELWGVVLYS